MAKRETKGLEQVRQRIQEFMGSGAAELNLSGLELTAMPDSITQLPNLRSLNLSNNQLSAIPDSITQLLGLTYLDIGYNQIATIPDSIAQLRDLTNLDLGNNVITAIPDSIGQLTNLNSLNLTVNRITAIPDSIGRLVNLWGIGMMFNQIAVIPESIGKITNLTLLFLTGNQITAIPDSISQLANLTHLHLADNQIAAIPASFSRLKRLTELDLSGNPLPDELMAAAKRGAEAFLRYLETTESRAAHPRTVKVVLLGEPGVGKTTLLEALKGNLHPCDPNRKETLGVNVVLVPKTHPDDGQPMHLAIWDFAGQHIEHATHQPFLTENAVFLVLWHARLGVGAGKRDLWYWLELLKMRVRDPRFLLVATHTELTPPDLSLTEIRRAYNGLQGNFAVDLCTLAGFDALQTKIIELVAASPALKASWPPHWLPVRDEVRKIRASRPHISSQEFRRLMKERGIREKQEQKDLAEQLHQLGEILYFQALGNLSNFVILNPSWLSELVALVVRSQQARNNRGVLSDKDLEDLWRDANLDSEVRDHLIRLMDHFDLTYTTVDAGEARIVAEALPYSTPEELEGAKLPLGLPTMELIFRFPSLDRHLPPGIPTWGIARAHRLAVKGLGPWRDAAFFEDAETHSRAQILASDTSKEVRLKVTADYPPFFMGRMEAILQDTFKRYKELVPQRRLPCPCRPDCPESFLFDVVVRRRNSKETAITCNASGDNVPLESLLMGFSPTTAAGRLAAESELRRMYTALRTALDEQGWNICPSVFTLGPSDGFKQLPTFWESFTEDQELELGLYCEHDSGWHPTSDSIYRFHPNREWVDKLKANWGPLVAITLHIAPLLKAAGLLIDVASLKEIGETAEGLDAWAKPKRTLHTDALNREEKPKFVDIQTRQFLKDLIDHLDSERPHGHRHGGLHPRTVEDGRRLWLCPQHFEAYKIN